MRSDAEKAEEQARIARAYQDQHILGGRLGRRARREGVIVTPVDLVDFQLRSALASLRAQGIEPDSGVEWLDPFGGTGIYIARLLQIVEINPQRKRHLANHCVVIEIDRGAAQICADNLAAVVREETGEDGCVRVICADTFSLPQDADLFDEWLPVVLPMTCGSSRGQEVSA